MFNTYCNVSVWQEKVREEIRMIYLEYERLRDRFRKTQELFNETLLEKEYIFSKTQPDAIRYDKECVKSSNCTNKLDEYVIEMDEKRIDERLSNLRQLLADREKLLTLKEDEIRKSYDKFDRIYCSRYIDGINPNRIAKMLNYSKSQIYRMLGQIQETIRKDATRCD